MHEIAGWLITTSARSSHSEKSPMLDKYILLPFLVFASLRERKKNIHGAIGSHFAEYWWYVDIRKKDVART